MKTCPICHKPVPGRECENCGYDLSGDFTAFRTLSPVSEADKELLKTKRALAATKIKPVPPPPQKPLWLLALLPVLALVLAFVFGEPPEPPEPTPVVTETSEPTPTPEPTPTSTPTPEPTSHIHDWSPATCTRPAVCTLCGATQGSALGHSWVAASCTNPATCRVCGETQGSALGHSWKAATCTEAKTCTLCGETWGSPLGHTWVAATYEQPRHCSVCGLTEGEALPRPTPLSPSTMYFGRYIQSDKSGAKPEAIEWLVLKQDGNKCLLLSKDILFYSPYDDENEFVDWADCDLRKKLNNDFFLTAFSAEEQENILLTTLSGYTDHFDSKAAKTTSDYVFILSRDELRELFDVPNWNEGDDSLYSKLIAHSTPYAALQIDGSVPFPSYWFERTNVSASDLTQVYVCCENGRIDSASIQVDTSAGIRPAIWVTY